MNVYRVVRILVRLEANLEDRLNLFDSSALSEDFCKDEGHIHIVISHPQGASTSNLVVFHLSVILC
jgi:hypothetical protein